MKQQMNLKKENEMDTHAYQLGCKLIFNLIMRDYRSARVHEERKFNPTIFIRRASKMPTLANCINPMVLLEQYENEGMLLRCKTKDYSRVMFQITEKYCDYMKENTNFRIDMPLEKIKQKSIIKQEKKRIIKQKEIIESVEDTVTNEFAEHKDTYGIMALRKKYSNKAIKIKTGNRKSLINKKKKENSRDSSEEE